MLLLFSDLVCSKSGQKFTFSLRKDVDYMSGVTFILNNCFPDATVVFSGKRELRNLPFGDQC